MKRMLLAALAAVPLLLTLPARAELIIDDFTDPAVVELPGGADVTFTDGVGDLDSRRKLNLRLFPVQDQRQTVVRADVDTTLPGEYNVDVVEPGGTLFVEANYDSFNDNDLTRGGQYDTFFIDVTAAPPSGPPNIRVIVFPEDNNLVFQAFRDFPFEGDSGTMVLPFDSFRNRGGELTDGDFSAITRFELSFSGASLFGPWEVSVDRIYVGKTQAIPEPSGLALGLLSLAGLCLMRRVVAKTCKERTFE